MKKKFISPLFFLIISILLVACGSEDHISSGSANERDNKEQLVVNVANMNLSVLNVIKEKGWLEEEFAALDATVEWSQHPNGPPINEGIASKRIDLSVLGEGAVIGGAKNKLDTKLISLVSDGLVGVNYLISQKDSDITSVTDLKGKKVGVGTGTSSHVFLLKILDDAGLTQADIEVVNLAIPDAYPAFQTGQLDAWVTSISYANLEIANGANLVATGEEYGLVSPSFYVARGEFAKEHPELVEAYLKVINRAVDFAKTDYEDFIATAAKAANVDIKTLKAYETGDYQNAEPSDEILEQLQESADILVNLGYIDKKVDIASSIDKTYIQKVSN